MADHAPDRGDAGGDGPAAAGTRPEPLYDELRRLAEACFRGQPADHTLEPTALVHEAYLRLAGHRDDYRDRTHFVAVAVTAMRQILVDHARRRGAGKRGGRWHRVTLADPISPGSGREVDVLDVEDALRKLAALDERKARVVELRFYGGLTIAEVAALLDVSTITVNRDWWTARAWMERELAQGEAS